MTATYSPAPSARPATRLDAMNLSIWLIGCLSLMPNPAIPVGLNTRLQLVNLAVILCTIVRLRHLNRRATWLWLWISAPAILTCAWYVFMQYYPMETAKLCLPWILSSGHLIAATGNGRGERLALLQGVAAGIVVNVPLALLQLLTIPADQFPLWWMYPYGNDSGIIYGIKSAAGMMGVRVFGFFSEPSDMTASIAHWLLLIIGVRMGLGGGDEVTRFCRSRAATATILGGGVLMMLSRSGHAVIFTAGVIALVGAGVMRRWRRMHKARWLVAAVSVMVLVGAYDVWTRIETEQTRLTRYQMRSSWGERGESISQSVDLWTASNGVRFVTGLGFDGANTLLSVTGRNVWSVAAKSILTFGLGAIVMWIGLAAYIIAAVLRSGAAILGLVVAVTLALGICLTTSYETLISPWIAISVLASWRTIFAPRRRTAVRHAAPGRELLPEPAR